MSQQGYYYITSTPAGYLGMLASADGLLRTTLPQPSEEAARQSLGGIHQARWTPDLFQDLTERLLAYFSGNRAAFPDKLDLSGATAWQRRVWRAARLIPYGETRSYKWLAEQLGKPAAGRAVGRALGSNPLPIIVPCHRILASNGSLGGFSGGLEMKRYLLLKERISHPQIKSLP